MGSPDFTNKNDYQTLKEKVSLKKTVANIWSLESLQEALETPESEEGETPGRLPTPRIISPQLVKSGSLLSQKKTETFEKFCARITNLYIRGKEIEQLGFGGLRDGLPGLLSLDLSDNFIQKLENLEPFGSLEVLQLQGNQIQTIEGLEKNRKLRILNLRNNFLSRVEGLESQLNLRELDLAGQRSEEGLTLTPGCFECLVALQSLDLNQNVIHNVHELAVLGGLIRKPD